MTTVITETTAATFDTDVLEASRTQPVVVDFWAPWCGPCHQLAPILERAAARHPEVRVVKLNVDEAPGISQRFGIRGIPAVKAFVDGQVAAEFTGVQPEPAVEQFLVGLAPSEADRLVVRAREASGAERETLLRQAVDLEPGHRDGVLELARLAVERGARDEAAELLARLPADDEVRTLLAELALAGQDSGADLDELRAAADSGDAAAALQLGSALAARGEHVAAVEHLLAAVADPEQREPAREALLAIFAIVGDDSELVRTARPRLARALF
jgi:putative thioredoxin